MMNLVDLTPEVRAQMLAEVGADRASESLYTSPRLTEAGVREYPPLLEEAIREHDSVWLMNMLNRGGRLKHTETRKTKSGVTTVNVPHTAAETLADGEFNRFYIRGLCLVLLSGNPDADVEVYRAKQVETPRSASQEKIGKLYKATALLADMRACHGGEGLDTALGIPAGPNSGLSIRVPVLKA